MLTRACIDVESPDLAARLQAALGELNVLVLPRPTGRDLLQSLAGEDLDVVLLSRSRLPAAPLIASALQLPGAPELIVFVAETSPEERSALLATGCLAVLDEVTEPGLLRAALGSLIERARQSSTPASGGLSVLPGSLADFAFDSPAMQRFVQLARRVVDADSSLLVLGETGVGKERLARAIHGESRRSAGPFVAVNCGALPEHLLESELFGHERGAFTGAVAARRGYFEQAHDGTIFLDEIGELPLHLQVKLLRVLEDRRIQRLGGDRAIVIDVRVMAATNRDLESEMAAGRFRQDLFYRLAVVSLELPPLRERSEDVPLLVRSYLDHFRRTLGRLVEDVSPEAMEALRGYAWPGNVRELINVVEQTVLLCPGSTVELPDLPRRITERWAFEDRRALAAVSGQAGALDRRWREMPLPAARREVVGAFERAYLSGLLAETGGRVGETAQRAGVSARSIYELMRRHGLEKREFRARKG